MCFANAQPTSRDDSKVLDNKLPSNQARSLMPFRKDWRMGNLSFLLSTVGFRGGRCGVTAKNDAAVKFQGFRNSHVARNSPTRMRGNGTNIFLGSPRAKVTALIRFGRGICRTWFLLQQSGDFFRIFCIFGYIATFI